MRAAASSARARRGGSPRRRRGVPGPGLYPAHHPHVVGPVAGLRHHAEVDGVRQLTRVCAQVHVQPVLTVRFLQQVRHLYRVEKQTSEQQLELVCRCN